MCQSGQSRMPCWQGQAVSVAHTCCCTHNRHTLLLLGHATAAARQHQIAASWAPRTPPVRRNRRVPPRPYRSEAGVACPRNCSGAM